MNLDELIAINSSSLNWNQAYWLMVIADGSKYLMKNEDKETIIWLKINGYITVDETITDKGKEYLNKIFNSSKVSKKVDISNKWHDLHKELQTELVKLTGKKQAKANGDYTFLCNEIDLQNKLSKVIVKYKLTDWDRIKNLLILHIRKAHKQQFQKIFLIQYYIEKNGTSTLASDYENYSEKNLQNSNNNSTFDGINI